MGLASGRCKGELSSEALEGGPVGLVLLLVWPVEWVLGGPPPPALWGSAGLGKENMPLGLGLGQSSSSRGWEDGRA